MEADNKRPLSTNKAGKPNTLVGLHLFPKCTALCHLHDVTFRGMGLGKALVVDALKRSVAMHEHVGIHLVVVDPLGKDVIDFYAKIGFEETENGQFILPVKTVKAAMAR